MPRPRTASPVVRWAVNVAGLLLIGYLAAVALRPAIVDALPKWLGWFGRPGSMPTLGIVVAVLIAVCVLTFRSDVSHRMVGVSFTVIAALITMSAVLGLSSYWGCHDANHPAFFTPLMATAQLVKGSIGDYSLGGRTCPSPTPVGLELARIAGLATGSGAERDGFKRGRPTQARPSTRWRAPRVPRKATGSCADPMGSNGRSPQMSSHAATPNSIPPKTTTFMMARRGKHFVRR